ncbi:MAG: flavocytochrome c [Clostridia bacterium]
MKKTLALMMALVMLLGMMAGASAQAAAVNGAYTGEAMGNNDMVTVEVTFEDGKITKVVPVKHAETAGIGDVAMEKLAAQIVENQSVAVDVVAGATNSSYALINATGEAIRAAGANLDDYIAPIAKPEAAEKATDLECDVVVVGAGGAGMVAALQAVEDGAQSVVIVEKMGSTGGNTVRSTGGMNAAGTPEQAGVEFAEEAGVEKTLAAAKEKYGDKLGELISTVETQWNAYKAAPQGYFDTVELFELDTLVGGKNLNDPALVKTLATQAKDGIAWLHTIGADLTSVGAFGGASVKRIHRPVNDEGKTTAVGSYLVPIFTAKCEENEKIQTVFETKATEVIMQDGKAAGVKVEGPAGAYNIAAKAVILASGGFGANAAMVEGYKPELTGYVTTNAPGATGDGIAMGEAVGAATVDMDQIQIHPTVEQKTSALITEGLRGDGAILINQEGKRFCDEVGTRDAVSAAEIAQTGSYAYLVVDQKMVDASGVIAGYISKGYTVQGDTYEALAEQIGADGANLTATMDTWNAAVTAGADAEFGRTAFAKPLDTAPFYAIKIAPGVHHTMGGLKINSASEVLSTEGTAIPGLFAAGEVTGGVHGANRLGGNAVADIVVYGRIAGASASAYIK